MVAHPGLVAFARRVAVSYTHLRYGEKNFSRLRAGIFASFTLIAALTFVINAAVFLWIDPLMRLLSVPVSVYGLIRCV